MPPLLHTHTCSMGSKIWPRPQAIGGPQVPRIGSSTPPLVQMHTFSTGSRIRPVPQLTVVAVVLVTWPEELILTTEDDDIDAVALLEELGGNPQVPKIGSRGPPLMQIHTCKIGSSI